MNLFGIFEGVTFEIISVTWKPFLIVLAVVGSIFILYMSYLIYRKLKG